MLIKIIILTPTLYFLALLQSSFLPHFIISGYIPNLFFALMIFFIFFAPSVSFISAFLGGIFLDIFSTDFLGFNVLILLGILFFVRLFLKKYVQISLR